MKWEDKDGKVWELWKDRDGLYYVFFATNSKAEAEKWISDEAVGARLVSIPPGTSKGGNSRYFRNMKRHIR